MTTMHNTITLFELVDQQIAATGNERRKFMMNHLINGKFIYIDLIMRNVINGYKSKRVAIDKSQYPYVVTLPKDCMRFVSLGVTNEKHQHRNLVYKNDMAIPVVQEVAADRNICNGCGKRDVVREQVDRVQVVISDVELDGQSYPKTEYTKVLDDGTLVKIIRIPVKDYDSPNSNTVRFVEEQVVLCTLEKKGCGCIATTPANISLIHDYCGCTIAVKPVPHSSMAAPFSGYGYVRQEGNKLYIEGWMPDNAIVTYVTNAFCPEHEILIPVEAVNAMTLGMNWRKKIMSENSGRLDTRAAAQAYERAIELLLEFQHPIHVSEFMDLQMTYPKWGAPKPISLDTVRQEETKRIEAENAPPEVAVLPTPDPQVNPFGNIEW